MWSAYRLGRATTTQITLDALDGSHETGRSLPQRFGLTIGQMARALGRLGYEPFIYDISESTRWKPVGTVYGYVSSNVPVILTCRLPEPTAPGGSAYHAVLAVGVRSTEGASPSRSVSSFIVQDDRYGPYVEFAWAPEDRDETPLPGRFRYHNGEEREAWIDGILVPLPPGVATINSEAHIAGSALIRRAAQELRGPAPEALTMNTYLMDSNILKLGASSWSDAVLTDSIRQTALPHWVWVTEGWEEWGSPNSDVRSRAVTDPTALRDAEPASRALWLAYAGKLVPVT
jgi:hypothetical protein